MVKVIDASFPGSFSLSDWIRGAFVVSLSVLLSSCDLILFSGLLEESLTVFVDTN